MDSCKWDRGVVEANAHNKSGCNQNKRWKKFYAIQHHSATDTATATATATLCVYVSVNTIVNNTEIGNRGFLGEYKVMHELIDLGGFSGEEKICTQLMRYILQLVICNAFIDLL